MISSRNVFDALEHELRIEARYVRPHSKSFLDPHFQNVSKHDASHVSQNEDLQQQRKFSRVIVDLQFLVPVVLCVCVCVCWSINLRGYASKKQYVQEAFSYSCETLRVLFDAQSHDVMSPHLRAV